MGLCKYTSAVIEVAGDDLTKYVLTNHRTRPTTPYCRRRWTKVERWIVQFRYTSLRSSLCSSILLPVTTTSVFILLRSIAMAATLLFQVSCPLLAVPGEIRLEVYRYLFDGAQLSIESAHPTGSPCGFTICSCAFPWHILRTCKKLRSEALPYLLAATTLEVASTMVKAANIPSSYLSAIPRAVVLDAKAFTNTPFQLDVFTSLKLLELRNITIWCKYHDEAYLESEEGDESMYGLAMFNLSRISNLLVELCTGLDRPFGIRLCCQYVVSSLTHETIHAVIDVDSKAVLHKSRGPSIKSRNNWAGFY